MNARVKKWVAISLENHPIIILIALILFVTDIVFFRFMELKALDLRMVPVEKSHPAGKRSLSLLTRRA